ncbi:MAG: AsmA family protein, partial [Solirubrobacteraceae bacterium]|nr:AsmA family protein [Solirubrobacteraceae bacterium]
MTPSRRIPPALRALLAAAALLVALFLAAWAVLAVVFPPARVRALVEERLSATLARPVRFEAASVSLWPPVRLQVRGLALAEPGGFDEGEAVVVKGIDLDLDAFALLRRQVLVRRLTLDQPALHLVLRPDGTTNLDGLMKPADGGPGDGATKPATAPDLAVSELAVRGGRVLVDDLRAGRRVAFGVDTRLGFSAADGGARIGADGETVLRDVAFGPLDAPSLEALNRGLAKVEWRIAHRGDYDAAAQRVTLGRLALLFDRTAIEVTGTLEQPGPRPALDLQVRGEGVDVAEVLRMVAVADARALNGVSGSGRLDFDLAVKGRPDPALPPPVTGVVTLRDAAFKYPGVPVGVEALGFTAALAPDSVAVPDLACRVGGQPVRAQFSAWRLADPRVRFAVQGDLDLAAVGPLVAPKEVKLGGRAAVDVRGSGRAKEPAAMALEGTARLAAVTLAHPQLPRPVERIDGELRFAGDRVAVRGLTMRAGKSSLALEATVTRPLALGAKPDSVAPAGVDFTLTSPYLDLAELLPPAGGGPSLPNARGGGSVEIARFRNGALDARDVKAAIQLAPGV